MKINKSLGMPKRIDLRMSSPSHSITRCIDMLKRGDRDAAEALWDSYIHRLTLNRERWLKDELARANDRLADQQKQTQEALQNKTVALTATSKDLERERQASYLQRIGLADIVRLFDVATGHEVLTLRGHSNRVWGVNFSPGGDSLVSASADGKVLLWNASHAGRDEATGP
jgi:WD40 repeat protein